MRNTQPFYTVFRVLKVYIYYKNSYIRYMQHQFFYFLLFYISFYISKYHFVQLFKTSVNIEDIYGIFRTIEEIASGISRG